MRNVRTYPAIAQELDHVQRLFDIWDLLFEPASALRQVAVHIAVLPRGQAIAKGRMRTAEERYLKDQKDFRDKIKDMICA